MVEGLGLLQVPHVQMDMADVVPRGAPVHVSSRPAAITLPMSTGSVVIASSCPRRCQVSRGRSAYTSIPVRRIPR